MLSANHWRLAVSALAATVLSPHARVIVLEFPPIARPFVPLTLRPVAVTAVPDASDFQLVQPDGRDAAPSNDSVTGGEVASETMAATVAVKLSTAAIPPARPFRAMPTNPVAGVQDTGRVTASDSVSLHKPAEVK